MIKTAALTTRIFAYGSNLSTRRMKDRICRASVLTTGYVPRRRLVFHKRSVDGSAKADAFYTGDDQHRVWGAVYEMSHRDRCELDRFEYLGTGYDRRKVDVVVGGESTTAWMYVARSEAIDTSLRPYDWYHALVMEGAREHRLPQTYFEGLAGVATVEDPDPVRAQRHWRLIYG